MDCDCLRAVEGEREVECPTCFGHCDTFMKTGEIVADGEVGDVGHTDYCRTCNGKGRAMMIFRECPDCKKEVVVKIKPL